MTRQHHPFVNPNTGEPECLYAGCGKGIPPDHFLCKRHYALKSNGEVEPCPGEGCLRFKSVEYQLCADCAKHPEPESELHWDAGDDGCQEFYAYLLVNPAGEWYAGHTRSLRNRLWSHHVGKCQSTAGGDYRLAWFEMFLTREEAAARVLDMVFTFQARVALVHIL